LFLQRGDEALPMENGPGERSMRKLLLCGVLLCAFAAPSHASQGYRGGWCLVANLGAGAMHENCSYPTFEMCRANAFRFGSTAFCRVSGYAVPGYWASQEPRRIKKKRKSRNY
jgi:hypothetical protein